MKREYHTKNGKEMHTLTKKERDKLALNGDTEALKEQLQENLAQATTSAQKISAILKYLRVKE